ncbi:hypothetical protein FRB99_006178 [Tulasnella sp. 403]|nr:hypothetical protein FRB99_006178 [Tulasnella sp. 403]
MAHGKVKSKASMEELQEIDRYLKEVEVEMRRLKKEMEELQERARKLRHRRRHLTTNTPWINRLPSDILAQIMDRGTESFGSDIDLMRDRVKLPLAVSQVSKRWRRIALQRPSLWTYINMQEGRPYDRTILWLKRSRNMLLDIDLDYRDQLPEAYYQRNFLITLNVILPTLPRWGSLRVQAPASLVETALHVFSAPAPHLHTLILKGWEEPGIMSDDPWFPTIFCRQTPRLQYVYLHGTGLRWDTCAFTGLRELTFSNLTRETIYTLESFSRLIGFAAPCLQRLSIIGSPVAGITDWDVGTLLQRVLPLQIALPKMLELRLESLDVLDVLTFILLLHTPYLRKLTLSKISRGSGRKAVDLDVLKRSPWQPDLGQLEHLACHNVDFQGGLFQSLCRAAPDVKRLDVRGVSANAILEYLTPEPLLMLPEEEIPLLPRLERLDVHDATGDIVKAFVGPRTASLREVTGTIMNERRFKRPAQGVDAVKQLGWEHNEAIHVTVNPVV